MIFFNFDHYNSNEISNQIKYWFDLWNDLIKNFNKNSFGLNLLNPHTLINDIIDELKYNDLKNTLNKKYFYNQIDILLKKDIVLKKYFQSEFKLIRQEFNGERKRYLLQLCQQVKKYFISGEYFRNLHFELISILISANDFTDNLKEDINYITQSIIIEFLLKKFSFEFIQSIPLNIFDNYYFQDKYLITQYPHNIDSNLFQKEKDFDLASFNDSIKKKIDSLTVENRLDVIKELYYKKEEEFYFIFPIEGLKGNVDFNIGDVNFYNPHLKKYIKNPEKFEDEYFDMKNDANDYYLNAAVKIKSIDQIYSKQIAIEKIDKALDIISCFYKTEINFSIALSNYLIVTLFGKYKGSSHSIKKTPYSIYHWHRSLNFDNYKLNGNLFKDDNIDKAGKLLFEESDKFVLNKKLISSIHWYRKAQETNKVEDKLIDYWIAIENIINFENISVNLLKSSSKKESVFDLIQNLIPAIELFQHLYCIGWDHYNYIKSLITTFSNGKNLLNLPSDLVNKANLNPVPGDIIDLKKFVQYLPELIQHIKEDIVKDKLIIVNKFYNEKKTAQNYIEKYINEIEEDLLLIYRYRNKIVHNAHYDTIILPYYTTKIMNYSGNLIRRILYEKENNRQDSIEEILISLYSKKNILIDKLKNNINVDLLHIENYLNQK